MTERGFSLVELITVIAVIVTLTAIATMQYGQYTRKTNIERQVRTVYADIMQARAEALLQKVPRSVKVTSTQVKVYPNADGSGTSPIVTENLTFGVSFDAVLTSFDARGVATSFDSGGTATTAMTICIDPDTNPGTIDSVMISSTMVQMGKRKTGACSSANFTAK